MGYEKKDFPAKYEYVGPIVVYMGDTTPLEDGRSISGQG
jgi:hypothetical protein